jgi:hypothetical protein
MLPALDWPAPPDQPITQPFGGTYAAEPPGYVQRDGAGIALRLRLAAATGFDYQAHAHRGVDIGEPIGTPVTPLMTGSVTERSSNSARGLYVTLAHPGGWFSRYQHLSSFAVSLGQTVGVGQILGRSGESGIATGPHLHVELWQTLDGVTTYYNPEVDPVQFITASGYGVQAGMTVHAPAGTQVYRLDGTRLLQLPKTYDLTTVGHADSAGTDYVVLITTATLYSDKQARPTLLLVKLPGVSPVPKPTAATYGQADLDAAKAAGFDAAKQAALAAVEGI